MRDLAVVPESDHEIMPVADSAYVIGPEFAGRQADLHNPFHYPVEAVCRCGRRIVCERMLLIGPEGEWRHEDRPGGE